MKWFRDRIESITSYWFLLRNTDAFKTHEILLLLCYRYTYYMKLLDGIFYQYYWAKFSRGFYNRLYQDPFGIACTMSILLSSASLPLIAIVLRMLNIDYSLKWLVITYYIATAICFMIYFFIKKRYKQIIINEEFNQGYYRRAAIFYPILCIIFMFACFMMMCVYNSYIINV